jgi:hypothetical protein
MFTSGLFKRAGVDIYNPFKTKNIVGMLTHGVHSVKKHYRLWVALLGLLQAPELQVNLM